MRKILTYFTLAIASLVVIIAFVTATSYIQLAVAIVLYPLFVYFALKVIPLGTWQTSPKEQIAAIQPASVKLAEKKNEVVVDIDKRAFLSLIGVTGVSFFLYSMFIKKSGAPLFGSTSEAKTVSLQDTAGDKIDPVEKQPTDGYILTEIDDSILAYFGFTHKDGSWFIMREDSENGSFRHVRGDSDFTVAWTDREQLKYDYYANVF